MTEAQQWIVLAVSALIIGLAVDQLVWWYMKKRSKK